MQTNTTDIPRRPACATGKDIVAQIMVSHWPRPAVNEGRPVIIDCMGAGCGFQSSHAALVGEDAIWAEHAYHVADLLEAAGIAETAGVADAERLRLADKLDEEAARRSAMHWLHGSEQTNLGWTQAANHLRHPTATSQAES